MSQEQSKTKANPVPSSGTGNATTITALLLKECLESENVTDSIAVKIPLMATRNIRLLIIKDWLIPEHVREPVLKWLKQELDRREALKQNFPEEEGRNLPELHKAMVAEVRTEFPDSFGKSRPEWAPLDSTKPGEPAKTAKASSRSSGPPPGQLTLF